MFPENKIFRYAMIISLGTHIVILTLLSLKKSNSPKKPRQIEVVYEKQKVEEKPKAVPVIAPLKIEKKEEKKDDIKILTKDSHRFDAMMEKNKDISPLSTSILIKDKQSADMKTFEGKRKISIPVLQSEKISNPKYLSYNETIRQKIKLRAYNYVDHPDFQPGQVYLTFVLNSEGTLTAVKIIEERTKANAYLRSVGVRAIKESSPFPPFPKEFNYPELTFNVVISFEVE